MGGGGMTLYRVDADNHREIDAVIEAGEHDDRVLFVRGGRVLTGSERTAVLEAAIARLNAASTTGTTYRLEVQPR